MTKDNVQAATNLANRFWEEFLQLEPVYGTVVGDERYDHLLDDPSPEGREKVHSFFEGVSQELSQLSRSGLTSDLRATLNILDFFTAKTLREMNCGANYLWTVNHMQGPQQLLVFLGTLHNFDTPERVDKFITRLKALPKYLDAISDVAMEAAEIGQTQPDLVVDRVIGQVKQLLEMAPAESPLVQPLKDISEGQRGRALAVLCEKVWPALGRYLDTLYRYRAFTRPGIGLNTMEKGEEVYAALIESYTTLPYTPQEVHDIGLEQFELIMQERQAVAENLGFKNAKAAVESYTETGKNTPTSRDEMLELAREQIQRSWDAAPEFFGRLPKSNCEVRPIEEFQENDMPAAYYMPPSGDGSRPGMYEINTGNLPKRMLHQLATVSYHEANPGHHFQLSIAQEFEDRLPVQRFGSMLVGSSFVEGWGLYSERLADEMGLYQNEYERIGMLEAQGWRACRLIVDSGIHALGWTREQAVSQMEKAGISKYESEVEVDRYIAMPGQALSYMTGQLAIQKTRRELEKLKGNTFSIKEFHDKVLSLGALPLNALKEEVLREAKACHYEIL